MHPKRHLIKIRTFLRKIDTYLEKYKFARRFEGLESTKFLEILKSNKTPNKFSRANLKLLLSIKILCASRFKSVREYASLDLKHLNFRIFLFILHHKYPNNQMAMAVFIWHVFVFKIISTFIGQNPKLFFMHVLKKDVLLL